jgi:hypothetical protein
VKTARVGPIVRRTLGPGIHLLTFPSQYALASTFLRVQEHYESSRFHGRLFTLEQFMDWYAATFGAFTYFEDWSGFNIPSSALTPFRDGRFDPLLAKEQRLLDCLAGLPEPFYVIGVVRGVTPSTLRHEVAHALFALDSAYRREVRRVLRETDTRVIARQLRDMGYAPHVIDDEVHAYLIEPSRRGAERAPAFAPVRRRLRAIFSTYAKGIRWAPFSRS